MENPKIHKNTDFNEYFVSAGFWQTIYRHMLLTIPIDLITEFIGKIPIRSNKLNLADADLLTHLWKKKSIVPVKWENETSEVLEWFLVEKKIEGREKFIYQILDRNNKSTWIAGKLLLQYFYKNIFRILSKSDSRHMVFTAINIIGKFIFPSQVFSLICKRENEGWIDAWMLHVTDKSFKEVYKTNLDWVALPQLKLAPRALGLADFEQVSLVSDTRGPTDIIPDCELIFDDGKYVLDGEYLGRPLSFSRFCEENNLNVKKFAIPNTNGIYCERDVFCSKRNRVVLHKNCFYNSAVYIIKFGYKKSILKNTDLLDHFISDTIEEDELITDKIEMKHQELLNKLKKISEVKFEEELEAISIDNETLVRGRPAYILFFLLDSFIKFNKKEFTYEDLRSDVKVFKSIKERNLWIHTHRLAGKLEQRNAIFRVEFGKKRGSFSIKVLSKFTLVSS